MKRYIVGTRDTDGTYRAIRIESDRIPDAKEAAVRRLENMGVSAVATSCKRINALGA